MKYYTITVPLTEPVVVSYFHRTIDGCLLKRLKTVCKLFVPETLIKNQKQFIKFVRSIAFKATDVRIKLSNSPKIDNLSLVEYAELLFDSKAEDDI